MLPQSEPNPRVSQNRRVLFVFNHPAASDLFAIEHGTVPSERLYGFVELRRRGWPVSLCEERHEGRFLPRFARVLQRVGLDAVSWRMVSKIYHSDVVLVKASRGLALEAVAEQLSAVPEGERR